MRIKDLRIRVVEPPPPGVRALPPHKIRNDGVGPYRLGATLAELLDQLPSGPRIAQFNIPGIVHRDLLRAEDDAILIGGEPQGRASFVAVVGGDVARTESGIHVGSTRNELVGALGLPVDDPERASDPRVVRPSNMKNLRAVIKDDRIVALVVSEDARRDYLDVIDKLVADGAEAVVLACTEQGLLLRNGDAPVPLIDTTMLHCAALTDFILTGANS